MFVALIKLHAKHHLTSQPPRTTVGETLSSILKFNLCTLQRYDEIGPEIFCTPPWACIVLRIVHTAPRAKIHLRVSRG